MKTVYYVKYQIKGETTTRYKAFTSLAKAQKELNELKNNQIDYEKLRIEYERY